MENVEREYWERPPTSGPAYTCEKCGGKNTTPHNHALCPQCRREAEAAHMVKVFGGGPPTPKSYRKHCARCGTTITAFDAHTHCDPCAKEIKRIMDQIETPNPNQPPSEEAHGLVAQLGCMYPPTLAKALGVSESALQLWRQNGSGPPFVKTGKYVLYRMVDVQQWLAENVVDRVRQKTTTEVPPVQYKQQGVWEARVTNVNVNPIIENPIKQVEGNTDER